MKYLFLLLVFSGLAFAGDPPPLGGCKAQEIWVEDGGQYCEWIWLNPGFEFICSPTGSCFCNPFEDGRASTPTDPIERLRQMLQKSPIRASLVSSAMRERLKVPAVAAKPAKGTEKEAAPK